MSVDLRLVRQKRRAPSRVASKRRRRRKTHQFTLRVQPPGTQLRLLVPLDTLETDSSLRSNRFSRRRSVDDPRESFVLVGRREEKREKESGEVVVTEDVAAELSKGR